MSLVAAALIIVAGAALAAWLRAQGSAAAARAAEDAAASRRLQILTLFRGSLEQASADPRAFVTWAPLASAVRALFPADCAELDRAFGRRFPFSEDDIQRAHGRWTADWLAWERTHDGVYKLKAAEARAALAAVTATNDAPAEAARARVDDVEREKLEIYQRRYEEYVRISKALQALQSPRP